MMNQEIKKLWIENLTNNKYKQGTCYLRSFDNKYCCLGVLYEITGGVWEKLMANGYITTWGLQSSLGIDLSNRFGITDGETSQLICMNDDEKKPFIEIAKWIGDNL